MKIVSENINEAIKHLEGRSEEEIWEFFEQESWKIDEPYEVYNVYKRIIEQRPFIKTILEDIFMTTPQYRLMQINKNDKHFSFYFNTSASMGMAFRKPKEIELLIKHRVNFLIPGNTNYSFYVSISDEAEIKPEVNPEVQTARVPKRSKYIK